MPAYNRRSYGKKTHVHLLMFIRIYGALSMQGWALGSRGLWERRVRFMRNVIPGQRVARNSELSPGICPQAACFCQDCSESSVHLCKHGAQGHTHTRSTVSRGKGLNWGREAHVQPPTPPPPNSNPPQLTIEFNILSNYLSFSDEAYINITKHTFSYLFSLSTYSSSFRSDP